MLTGSPPARATAGSGTPLHVLLLGDSYIAGNGASAFQSDPSDDLAAVRYYGGSCYRSHLNWESRYAAWLHAQGHPVTLVNRACSGATSIDVLNEPLAEVSADDDVVILTVGGKDLHFRDIVEQCFVPGLRDPGDCRSSVQFAHDHLNSLSVRLEQILEQIGATMGSDGKVVLVSYPYLERDRNYTLRSRAGLPGGDRYAVGAAIRDLGDDGERMQHAVVDAYNAARGAGAQAVFVDGTKAQFTGHEPHGDVNNRGADRWIFSYLDTGGPLEWYHPSPLGHAAWARLLEQSGDFGAGAGGAGRTEGAIDLVFTIDTTGSMSGVIATVRDRLRQVVANLEARSAHHRVALVTYKADPSTRRADGLSEPRRARLHQRRRPDTRGHRPPVRLRGRRPPGDRPLRDDVGHRPRLADRRQEGRAGHWGRPTQVPRARDRPDRRSGDRRGLRRGPRLGVRHRHQRAREPPRRDRGGNGGDGGARE